MDSITVKAPDTIHVRPINASDQAEVRELILCGLEEHWGFRDPSKNPDLADICRSYEGATFLVGCEGDRIVGTGALKLHPGPRRVAQVVRMSVAADRRRRGVGRIILRELLRHARCLAVCTVVLETTETWHDVIRFYLAQGFTVTHYADGDVHFALQMGESNRGAAAR